MPSSPVGNGTQGLRITRLAAITGPGSALASRVIVNRLWHHVFGRGIVSTTDNFGKLGEAPAHPWTATSSAHSAL